jgi:hypothetical protein
MMLKVDIFFCLTKEKAAELKHDATVAAHNAQEKVQEVAHTVQGRCFFFLSLFLYG